MALASKTVQLVALLTFAITASEASAKNFGLTMQSAPVAKQIKTARPAPPPKSRSQKISTELSCQGAEGDVAWTCQGIAKPGTRTTLTYSVTLTD